MWPEKHGRTYRIRDRIAGELVTLRSGYPTKASAQNAIMAMRADRLRGDFIDPRGGRVTLNELIDLWWPDYRRKLKPSAVHSEGGRVRNHIRALLGHLCLDELDTLTVNQWLADLEHGRGPMGGGPTGPRQRPRKRIPLAPKTVHNVHGLLFVIMAFAIAQKLRRDNPCASSTLPARVHREMRFLTDPEIERLILAMPQHWRPLIILLVSTGLRWGEAIGLRVGRVDLLAKRPKLRIEEQLQETADGELIFVSPKSARSRRTVSFTRPTALVLAPLVAGKESGELVFLTVTGRPVRTRNFRREWLAACEAAGLTGLRIHDLRHTHAAILLSAGVKIEKISRRLGHASIAVTDMIYGHLREEADEEVLAAIDDAIKSIGSLALAAELADEFEDDLR